MNILDRFANIKGLPARRLFGAFNASFVNGSQIAIFRARHALEKQINAEKAKPAIDFSDPKLRRLQQRSNELGTAKSRIAETVTLFATTITAIFDIKAALEEAKAALQTIQPTSDAAFRAAVASQFDGKLDKLNKEVDNAASGGKNRLDAVDRLTFRTAVNFAELANGGSVPLTGSYVGTEYYIREDNGNKLLLDTPRTGFIEYSNYPSGATGTRVDIADLVIDSYDPATGAITISSPTPITGTLVRGGLGVLNSKFYGDFATDADVTAAIADIDGALSKLELARMQVRAQEGLFKAQRDALDDRITEVDDDTQARIDLMLDERQAKIFAMEARMHVTLSGLSLTTAAGSLLIESLFLTERRAPGILDFTA
jgi:hypothetical protein